MRPITETWRCFVNALDTPLNPELREEMFLELRRHTPFEDGVWPAFLFAQKQPEQFFQLVDKAIPATFLSLSEDIASIKRNENVATILRLAIGKRSTRDVAIHFLFPLAWSLHGPSIIENGRDIYMDEDCYPILKEVLECSAQPI